MAERDDLPPMCQWHDDEIQAMKAQTGKHQDLISSLATDIKILTTRIPADLSTAMATVQLKVNQALDAIQAVDRKVSESYVRREEFAAHVERYRLIERLVFGTVALICVTVLTAIIYTVVRKGGV